ncbi:MAG: hypothetical protein Q8M11_06150 [Sulfuritalea sp.]|nr:hypothetical protein [Sulfuritalea sp.]MDP1983039.1 hypothetical protein [Sulfuritalea sp.]
MQSSAIKLFSDCQGTEISASVSVATDYAVGFGFAQATERMPLHRPYPLVASWSGACAKLDDKSGEIRIMMSLRLPSVICALATLVCVHSAGAQPALPGSIAFCLFEVPLDETGKRRWINLGIVQYIDATPTEVRIYYGAGSLGSGHEAKIIVPSMEAALLILDKMRRMAATCR